MKHYILTGIATIALLVLSGCASRTVTTTTEESTTVHRPTATSTTTETQVVRPGY